MGRKVPGTGAVATWRIVALGLAVSVNIAAAVGAVTARRVEPPEPLAVAAATAVRSDSGQTKGAPSVPAAVARIQESVVAVHAAVETDDPGMLLADAVGTGFAIRSDGMIATAAHVVHGAWSVSVTLVDGSHLAASIVGVDAATDLAVLHVDRDDLVPVVFGRTADLEVGEPVIAIGHALGLGSSPTVSAGVLSAVERTVTGSDGRAYDHLLQTDAAINDGHSGGPLINAHGDVIGMNTSKITAGDAEGVGFAICTDHARPVLEDLETR